MLQAITGVRPLVHRAKHSVVNWSLRKDTPIALTCTMRGDQAYDFMDRCINLVFPRIKEWAGVKGESYSWPVEILLIPDRVDR